MALREYELKADTRGAIKNTEGLKEAIDDATAAAKKQEEQAKKTAKEAEEAARKHAQATDKLANEGINLLDRLTGGLAGMFEKSFKAVQGLNLGLKGMKAAIAATGIGLLVVAVGALVENWEKVLGFLNGASSAQKQLLNDAAATSKTQQESLDAISAQENILKLQGKSEKEIRDLKIQQTDETIKALEAQLLAQEEIKKEQIATAQRNQKILSGILNFIMAPLNILLETVSGIANLLGADWDLAGDLNKAIASAVFDPEAIAEEADKGIEETKKQLEKLRNTRAGYVLQGQAEDKAAAEKLQAQRDKANQERLQKEQELQKRLLESEDNYQKQRQSLEQKYDELVLAKTVSDEQQEINGVLDKFFALEEYYKDNAEALKLITEQKNKELADINNKYRTKEDDEDKKAQQKKVDRRKEIQDLIVGSALATIDSLIKINELGEAKDEESQRRRFDRNKNLQILQAIINTASGIMTQLNVPQDALTGANFVKAAIVAATGATQIATISAQQFKAEGSGAAKTPTAPSVASAQPSFNIVGQSGTNQLLQSISDQFKNPMKAYVVNGEVMSGAELERKRIRTATFG
jgi:hypothetical protein